MKPLLIYKLLTYLLLPIVALFGLMDVIMLLIALASPSLLLPFFILACVVVYTFASYSFLLNGIERIKPCKHWLKDFIKVNAFVTLLFAFWNIFQNIKLLNTPDLINQQLAQVKATQPNIPSQYLHMLPGILNGTLYFMIGFSVVLLMHVLFTFTFLKQYAYVFEGQE